MLPPSTAHSPLLGRHPLPLPPALQAGRTPGTECGRGHAPHPASSLPSPWVFPFSEASLGGHVTRPAVWSQAASPQSYKQRGQCPACSPLLPSPRPCHEVTGGRCQEAGWPCWALLPRWSSQIGPSCRHCPPLSSLPFAPSSGGGGVLQEEGARTSFLLRAGGHTWQHSGLAPGSALGDPATCWICEVRGGGAHSGQLWVRQVPSPAQERQHSGSPLWETVGTAHPRGSAFFRGQGSG